MIPPNILIPAVIAIAAAGFVMSGGVPLSLASDVGLGDQDVCSAVNAYGPVAVERLEATGFPHATAEWRERYRLTRVDEVKAFVEIDWSNKHAFCVPLDPTLPYTASFDMNAAAYSRLVGELRSVISTGELTGGIGGYTLIVLGTDVATPTDAHDHAYERRLAVWATGQLAAREASG